MLEDSRVIEDILTVQDPTIEVSKTKEFIQDFKVEDLAWKNNLY